MQQAAADGALLRRGVWVAPYLFDGVRVLIAVDSRGCVRKHVKIEAGVDAERAARWLCALLDRLDPVPQLRLVKSDSPRPTPIDPRAYEPVEDRAAYYRRLAREGARRMPYFRD